MKPGARPIRRAFGAMSIMAHQDDFEFLAGGLFALLRRTCGARLRLKILATTRGASGHHVLDPEATFRRRDQEARAAAALIGAEYECLRGLDGHHLPGQVFLDRNTLGGLWNAIRAFEPDFIFCPPVVGDPCAGIHIDHYHTACAVRLVAYQLSVPHAYPTMNGPPKLRVPMPLIINADDSYALEKECDFEVNIAAVYRLKERMALCHASQIFEWLPWNAGQPAPTRAAFRRQFRERHRAANLRYGRPDDVPREFFKTTLWGHKQPAQQLARLPRQ